MPSQTSLKIDLKGWEEVKKNLATKKIIKVGVLQNNSARPGSDALRGANPTNAEIGAEHEFGVLSKRLPRRSFLWDMILLKRKELVETAAKIIKTTINKPDAINLIYKRIGLAARTIVIKAFDTNGYGTWQALSPRRIREKQEQNLSPQTLVAHGLLRKAITYSIGDPE